ncbi:DUF2752 domain-containing protein [Rhodohalobacter sp. 614A]|uniref:DUF2752 domain-containing protein n=1 Tax=Rhodohalobacter sp. 614A TaxID=2908649 RepID=UPI00351D5855
MSGREPFKYYFFLHFEWIALISGLLLMAFLDPFSQAPSICPIDRLGFDFCPGCGLGKSIAFAARGNLSASFQSHPLGLFAILIILARIGSILRRNYEFKRTEKNEENI